MKLSERILEIAETEIVGADIFEKWAAEVEDLEDTRDGYKAVSEWQRSRIDEAITWLNHLEDEGDHTHGGLPEFIATLAAEEEANG